MDNHIFIAFICMEKYIRIQRVNWTHGLTFSCLVESSTQFDMIKFGSLQVKFSNSIFQVLNNHIFMLKVYPYLDPYLIHLQMKSHLLGHQMIWETNSQKYLLRKEIILDYFSHY